MIEDRVDITRGLSSRVLGCRFAGLRTVLLATGAGSLQPVKTLWPVAPSGRSSMPIGRRHRGRLRPSSRSRPGRPMPRRGGGVVRGVAAGIPARAPHGHRRAAIISPCIAAPLGAASSTRRTTPRATRPVCTSRQAIDSSSASPLIAGQSVQGGQKNACVLAHRRGRFAPDNWRTSAVPPDNLSMSP